MDAYSFHASAESLDATYEDMRKAYLRAFAEINYQGFFTFECGWKGGPPAETAAPAAKAFRDQIEG